MSGKQRAALHIAWIVPVLLAVLVSMVLLSRGCRTHTEPVFHPVSTSDVARQYTNLFDVAFIGGSSAAADMQDSLHAEAVAQVGITPDAFRYDVADDGFAAVVFGFMKGDNRCFVRPTPGEPFVEIGDVSTVGTVVNAVVLGTDGSRHILLEEPRQGDNGSETLIRLYNVQDQATRSLGNGYHTRVSPDRSRAFYVACTAAGLESLHLVEAMDGSSRPIIHSWRSPGLRQRFWSKDSSAIAFEGNCAGFSSRRSEGFYSFRIIYLLDDSKWYYDDSYEVPPELLWHGMKGEAAE